jgi:hypothetical protein
MTITVHPVPTDGPDFDRYIALALDIADFSSLLIGSVRFRTLHRLGLAEIGDPVHATTLDRLFAVDQPPICTTRF